MVGTVFYNSNQCISPPKVGVKCELISMKRPSSKNFGDCNSIIIYTALICFAHGAICTQLEHTDDLNTHRLSGC